MTNQVLSINKLSKSFGRIRAVNQLSFEVSRGNIFGILGPNGSGKTTTLGIILDVIKADRGTYSWFGQEGNKEIRKRIGAILEVPVFYPYLSALNNLKLIAGIREVPYGDIERVLKIVGLYDRRKNKFRTYSLGMKQRLAIAAALLGNPEVLILDEPTNGLDPQGIAEIRGLIMKIAGDGMTIILASHLLDEVQKVCSHVVVMKSGRELFTGKVNEVHGEEVLVELSSDNNEMLVEALKEFPGIKNMSTEIDKIIVSIENETNSKELNNFLIGKGIVLTHLSIVKKSLEEQFLELLAESND